ncbi:MAG: hypothetical protein V3V96_15630, partial [Acidiferrobacterales bacterium]
TAGLSAGTAATASDDTPAAVSVSAGAAGSGTDFSRQDHAHLLPTTVPRLATENVYTESQVWFHGSDVTAASAMTLGAGNFFDIAGNTDIDSITTIGAGTLIALQFDGTPKLVSSAANIVTPDDQDIQCKAGTIVVLEEYGAGTFRVVSVMNDVPNRLQIGLDPARKYTFFDDFIGTISTPISSTAGSGGANEAATISAGDGGRITLKTDDDIDVDTHAAVCTTLTLDTLDWSADGGGLIFETRLQLNDVSEAYLFVGFTDVISTTVEAPVYKTTGTDVLLQDAANACGVGYDIDGTTDEWWQGGSKAGSVTSATHSGTAPGDNTYVTIRVEVSAAGAVQGFINGTSIGTAVANAITTTTAITPIIVIGNRTANQIIAIIDYVHVSADR